MGHLGQVTQIFDLKDKLHLITGDEMGEIIVWNYNIVIIFLKINLSKKLNLLKEAHIKLRLHLWFKSARMSFQSQAKIILYHFGS